MTPVANEILEHIYARIVAAASPVEVQPISSALKMPNSLTQLVRVEVVNDVIEDALSTAGAQGAVGMALEIDLVVFARANKESSKQARALVAGIGQALLADHGVVNLQDVPRHRIEHASDDMDTDGDGATELTVIRSQYSVLYRHRRDNTAIAA